MERRLSSTTSKLRNFKDFFTSTKSLHRSKNSSNRNLSHDNYVGNDPDILGGGVVEECSKRQRNSHNNKKNSLSLFDLVDPPISSSRPTSMALSVNVINIHSVNDRETFSSNSSHNSTRYNNGKKSVSMYGLANSDCRTSVNGNVTSSSIVKKNSSTSRNPAVRLFNVIKSKFGVKRRRDRNNKIVDNPKSSDFGSFFSSRTSSSPNHSTTTLRNDSSLYVENDNSFLSSPRSQEQIFHEANRFDEQMDIDDTFATPLGSRAYENSKIIAASSPQINYPDDNDSFSDAVEDTDQDARRALDTEHSNLNTITSPSTSDESKSKPAIPLKQRASGSTSILNSNSQSDNNGSSKLRGSLTKELCDLLHYGWYWGGMSKEEAEEKLSKEPDGAFVVRDSSSDHYLLSLSFNSHGKTLHTRIEYRNGKFCFYSSETECFLSVAELIDYWITNSEQGMFCYSRSRQRHVPSYPVRLTKPISRFTEVKTLSHLSRFVIRQYTRLDLISQLPLPTTLKEYVGQQRYI